MHLQMLRTLYDRAIDGLPMLGRPAEEAQRLSQKMDPDEATDHLIHRAVLFSSATGFVCGLPGYLSMPLTIPSNVAGVLLVQFHMCAAIAALEGHAPRSASTRERAIQCVLDSDDADHEQANASGDETTDSGEHDGEVHDPAREDEVTGLLSRVTTKLGERGLRFVGEQAIQWTYRAARHGNRGSRGIPLLGGAIGAITDGMETRSVGQRARRAFLDPQSAVQR
jgi:hypothetical protein